MKKLILFFACISMIASVSYAGGFYKAQITSLPTGSGVQKSGTFNIGETQNYTMWVSAYPHVYDSGSPWCAADIQAYGKNNQFIADAFHQNTFQTGETQVSMGLVYVEYFKYSLSAEPDWRGGRTLYAV